MTNILTYFVSLLRIHMMKLILKINKKIYVLIIPLILLFFSSISQSKEVTKEIIQDYFKNPVFEDLWFGIYDENNIRYGWMNINEFKETDYWVQVNQFEMKYLEVVEDDETLLENEITYYYKIKEYFDYNYPHSLKKIEFELQNNNDKESFEAIINNGIAKVTSNNNGKTNNLEFKNVDIRFGDLLKLELLLRHYDDWEIGEIVNYKSYDMNSFEVSEEKDTLESIETKFYGGVKVPVYKFITETSDTRSGFTGFFSVNSGTPMERIYTYETVLLENKETAQNISFGGATNASETVTVDQILENNENIKRLVLEIDGEYEKGFYVGDRQNVYSKDGKKFLELDFDLYDDPPATKKDMEKNLKATSLYPSNDEYFINLAEEIIGDVEDPWFQVELLLDYVDIFIKDDYTSNSHSVYDIVEKKVGDCTEHALLFNTLARAAGIPSRELTGIINYEENKFALHAWNEVVVDGYWYPVDPTWNYIVPPLTHIKFDLLESVPATYNFKVVEIEYY